jgi:hypothetical protein
MHRKCYNSYLGLEPKTSKISPQLFESPLTRRVSVPFQIAPGETGLRSQEEASVRRSRGVPLDKAPHPWTNGQIERMNRTIKDATVRTYHYENHAQLRDQVTAFLNAYNFAKRLKTLSG